MNANDFVFVGLKSRVTALGKNDGQIVWTTQLPGGLGTGFVTISCDDRYVFACANGQISCLDLFSGRLLWTNGLEGHGYGIASIGLHGCPSASTAAAGAQMAQQSAASGGAAAACCH
jgi:outer membrane protein assembly factor BamB